jgi:sarcosine oxidase subunit beta
MTKDFVIIGGGSTGTSIAWQLARLKAGRVLLLDKATIAGGATGKSSGVVRTHYLHETLARMALKARHVFENFGEIVGGESGFHAVGFLVPVGPKDIEAVNANVAMNRSLGIDAYVLGPEEGRELEPRMHWDDIPAAAWEPKSGYADPSATASSYAAAARREGAQLRVGTRVARILSNGKCVTGVELADGTTIATKTVVVAAGFRSVELLAQLGVELPITPIRHDIVIIRRSPGFGEPHPVVSDRLLGAYHLPQEANVTMIGTNGPGSAVDPDVEADKHPSPKDVEWLVERFLRRFPAEENAVVHGGYCGPYDVSPDVQPILGPVPGVDGLHVAAGFSGHGFKLSPVIGQMMADTIVHGQADVPDMHLFRLSRFAEGDPVTPPHPYSMVTLG